jgi:hypothetical protein
MSISIRKKIVGLMTGGSLTLLGVFLPVDGVSAASLKGLLNKDFWISVGGGAVYDQLAKPFLDDLPGLKEDEEIESFFPRTNIQTFIAVGGGVFYLDKNGKIADRKISAASFVSNNKVSEEINRSFKIEGTSPEKAPYLIQLDTVLGKTENGFFTDEPYVTISEVILKTGTKDLTGEEMYGGGFSVAFIDGEYKAIPLSFTTQSMKTEPIPEPITIFGSAIGLGFGTLFKKKYSKKQKKVKSLEKQKA